MPMNNPLKSVISSLKGLFAEKAQDRYITLMGDPIHTPPLKGLWRAPDVQAGVLATLFTGLAAQVLPDVSWANVVQIGGFNAFMTALIRWADQKFLIDPNFLKDVCINTKPEPGPGGVKPKNSSENIEAAEKMWGFNKATTIIFATQLFATIAILGSPENRALDLYILIHTSTTFTHLISATRRFNNVVQNQSVIEETPPPEPVKEKIGFLSPAMENS